MLQVGHNSWGLPDTSLVAVKMLKCTDSEVEEDFMKEVDVMAALKDENVVRLLGNLFIGCSFFTGLIWLKVAKILVFIKICLQIWIQHQK